eukprot:gene28985-34983_t
MTTSTLDFIEKVHKSIRSASFKSKDAQMIEELVNYIDANFIAAGNHLDDVCHLYISMASCSAEHARLRCVKESMSKCLLNSHFNREEFVLFSSILCDAARCMLESDDQTTVNNVRLKLLSSSNTETLLVLESPDDLLSLVAFYNSIWCEVLSNGSVDLNTAARLIQYAITILDLQANLRCSAESTFFMASSLISQFSDIFTPTNFSRLLCGASCRLSYLLVTSSLSGINPEASSILALLSLLHPFTRKGGLDGMVLTDLELAATDLSTALHSMRATYVNIDDGRQFLRSCSLSLYNSVYSDILNTTESFDMWSDVFDYITAPLSISDMQAIAVQCAEIYMKSVGHRDSPDGHPMEGAFVQGDDLDGFKWFLVETCLNTAKVIVREQSETTCSTLSISILLFVLLTSMEHCPATVLPTLQDLCFTLGLIANDQCGVVSPLPNILRKDIGLCKSIAAVLSRNHPAATSDSAFESNCVVVSLFHLMQLLVATEVGEVAENTSSAAILIFAGAIKDCKLFQSYLLFALKGLNVGMNSTSEVKIHYQLINAARMTAEYMSCRAHENSSNTPGDKALWEVWCSVLEKLSSRCSVVGGPSRELHCALRVIVECLGVKMLVPEYRGAVGNERTLSSSDVVQLIFTCKMVVLYCDYLALVHNHIELAEGYASTSNAVYELCGHVVEACQDLALQETVDYSLRCLFSDLISKALAVVVQRVYVDALQQVSQLNFMEKLDECLQADRIYVGLRQKMLGVSINGASYTLYLAILFTFARYSLSRGFSKLACWAFVEALLFRESCVGYMVDDPLFFPFLQEEIESLSDCHCLSAIDENLQYVLGKVFIPLLRVLAATPARQKRSAHAETVLNILIDSMFRSKGAGKASLNPQSYFRNIWRCARLLAAMCTDNRLVEIFSDNAGSKRLRQFLHNRMEVPVPHDYLLKDFSLVVVFLLISPELKLFPVVEIVQGKLHEKLLCCARCFNLQDISIDNTNLERSTISVVLFHQILLPLVWLLGSEDEDESLQGRRSILALCCCYVHDSWQVDKKRLTERHLLQHAQKELPQHFLHIMSSLLQHQWINQSTQQQSQNMRALRCLITMLLPVDVGKYLPKVLTMVESALTDFSRPSVQLTAVRVIVTLLNCLTKEHLSDSLYEMLVFLFPVIESSVPAVGLNETKAIAANFGTLFVVDHYAEHNSAMLDSFLPCNKDTFQKDTHPIAEAKKLAVQLLCDLFSSDPDFVVRLPYLPQIHDLGDLRCHLESALRPLTLVERIKRLSAFLTSSRLQVIHSGLAACREMIRENKSEILKACVQQRMNLFSIGADTGTVHEVSNLIVNLVGIARRQQNSRILVLCSACLGDIGALHPSLLTLGEEGVLATAKSSTPSFSPLNLDAISFGLQVLADYIVPGLKAAQGSSEQDKSAFAAQEVLRFLARKLEGSASDELNKTVDGSVTELPSALKRELIKRGIYDIVEPFWHSKYIQKPNERLVRSSTGSSGAATQVPSLTLTTSIGDGSRKGSYYTRSKSFHLWLAAWSRNLITLTVGSLKPIFVACRGMLHTSVELCQFLLPFLIVDVAINSGVHAPSYLSEIKTVLQCCKKQEAADLAFSRESLKYAVSETDRKAIQYIFSLLDTFTSWHAEAQKQLLKLEATSNATADSRGNLKSSSTSKTGSVTSKSSDDDRSLGNNREAVSCVLDALESILSTLPADDLSESALRIDAYARAIRYIETFAKDRFKADGNDNTMQEAESGVERNVLPLKRDMHVYDEHLPALSRKDTTSLSTAFAKLGDTDALQGVRAVSSFASGTSSSHENILWYEQQSDWYNALLEYDFLQSSDSYRKAATKAHHSWNHMDSDKNISSSGLRVHKRLRVDSTVQLSDVTSSATNSDMSLQDVAYIQRGKLRCLIELEQLEAVVTALQVQISSDSPADNVTAGSTISLGVEAAWKLSDWSRLDMLLAAHDNISLNPDKSGHVHAIVDSDDLYQVQFGQLMSNIHGRHFDRVPALLDQARLQAMGAFSAASMESYERAYPYLLRLHCLSDVEVIYRLLNQEGNKLSDLSLVHEVMSNLHWTERLDCLSETISDRSSVLATHRSLYSLFGSICKGEKFSNEVNTLIGKNRVHLSTYLKELGKYDNAMTALKYAQQYGVSEEEVVLRKGKLLMEQGLIREALHAVEPTEIDARALLKLLQGRNGASAFIQTEQKKKALSEKLFLATQCLAISQQCQGTVIIDRYHAITALTPTWDKPYLHFAKYYEYLFIQYNSSGSKQQAAGRTNNISVVLGHVVSGGSTKDFSLIEHALRQYGQCLTVCSDLVTIAEVLPRMLTLWLSFTALGVTKKSSASSGDEPMTPLKAAQQR